MMQAIKYRQWSGDRFYYWGFGVQDDGAYFTGPVSGGNLRVADQIHEQFTGLIDTNGVEIYEGDIIGGGELVAGYVAFKDGAFRLNQGHDNTTDSSLVQWRTGKLKVIGNIHQNPDLLESDNV